MQIGLLTLLKALWKRMWLVILAVLLCGAAGFCIARFCVTPMYKAGVMMYVNNNSLPSGGKDTISSSDLSAAQSLVDTYVVILNTRATLEEVADKANVNYSYDELKHMVSATAVNSTEVFEVTVTSADPEEAQRLVNTVTQVLPTRIASVVEGTSVRVVDNAVTPSKKASPSYSLYTMLGALVGFVVSVAYVILRELFDDRIHDEDSLLQMYHTIPVLAVIPELTSSSSAGYGGSYGYYGAPKQEEGTKK